MVPSPDGMPSGADRLGEQVLDAHCHAWRRWPYPPLVPDEDSRASVEQLLFEMDQHGVSRALVICASIENNPDNLDYAAFARARHPDRLELLADLDCTWSPTYHAPGGAERLQGLAERHPLAGFTHYLGEPNDGWLASAEADRVFALAARRGLLVSLSAGPGWQDDLRRLAVRHPSVPVLCHHLGWARAGAAPAEGLSQVLASAAVPNLLVKVSGFHYASSRDWDYPWPDARLVFRQIFDAYGPDRLCWGSDFPASRRSCTYRQSLEAVRQHCDFLSDEDRSLVLGGTLQRLLEGWRPGT